MYNKRTINRLTAEYLHGEKNVINELLENLIPMIDVILAKGYYSRHEYWEDLRQRALLELWKTIKRKPSGMRIALKEWHNASGYFYFRVRAFLNQKFNSEVYDDNKKNIIFFKDLDSTYKSKLGLALEEE